MKARHSSSGFTLLESLGAIFVFTLLSVAVAQLGQWAFRNLNQSQAVQFPTTEDSSCEVQEDLRPHWESFKRMRAAISQVRSLEEMTPVFLGDWSI